MPTKPHDVRLAHKKDREQSIGPTFWKSIYKLCAGYVGTARNTASAILSSAFGSSGKPAAIQAASAARNASPSAGPFATPRWMNRQPSVETPAPSTAPAA